MKRLRFTTLVAFGMMVLAAPAGAATIDTAARQAVLIDMTTGTTLFEKNAHQRMPTSSMSKVMTMYMVFEALKQGRLSMDDTMPVSQKAWRMQGSKMFTPLNEQIKVEDLIRGVIIQSGNDASIVLAEGLSGSEEKFAEEMTKRAKALGMTDTNLMNSTGWPHDNHYSTAHDLAELAVHLINDFPEYYHFYSEKDFTYHGIKQGNRNPLLYRDIGADGLKTGHTEAAGYGLMASAKRGDRRLVLVVNGLPNMQARADESARLMEWGFREFDAYPFFKAGETVEAAPVWMGTEATVPATVAQNLVVTMSREERRQMKVTAKFDKPAQAPIAKGDEIGKLMIEAPNFTTREVPLVAAKDVPALGFFGRMVAGARHLVSATSN